MKEMVSMNTKFIRIFNRLDLKIQTRILRELYKTGTLQPETIRAIGEGNGHLFLEELHMVLVKSLLNGVDFNTEKNIMETLKEEDPEFANVAMSAMFTFDDVARLPDDTVKKWLNKCKDDELVIALKDSNNYLINKILANMESERADKIKKEIDNQDLDLDTIDEEQVVYGKKILKFLITWVFKHISGTDILYKDLFIKNNVH